jgi:meiotic recombination protein SPO11
MASAASPATNSRQRAQHIISQVVLHIVRKLTGADLEDAVDRTLQPLIEKHVPVPASTRPAYGARMVATTADMRLWRLIAVMKACMDVLTRGPGTTTTKRAIYYSDVELFGNKQSNADRAIEQAVTMLANIDSSFGNFARHSLGIVAAKRGMVYGQVIYKAPNGNKYNCAQGTGWSIEPSAQGGTLFLHSNVDRVLVVEKETIFNRLAQHAADDDGAPAWLKRCILITGKGYPDVATRIFLRALLDPDSYSPNSPKPANLKVYGLVDGDPHGLDILSVYINGSGAMQYAGKALRIPEIMWLGVRHSDVARLNVPEHVLLPFSSRDSRVTARLLSNPERLAAVHALAADHLRALDQSKAKAEIECLYETELGLLTYIERAMELAAAEPARPIYSGKPTTYDAGAASSAGSTDVSRLDCGNETEDKGAGSSCAAADFDWFTSEEEDSSDEDRAMLCRKCNKWSDANRMRGTLCFTCWRRQGDYGKETQQEFNSFAEVADDFDSD